MNYNNTIDDEFASMFLQELQNTKSVRSEDEIQDESEDTENIKDQVNRDEIDYINSIDFDSNAENFNIIGHASYARYLPLETTFTSNIFDANDFQYLNENLTPRNISNSNLAYLLNSSKNDHFEINFSQKVKYDDPSFSDIIKNHHDKSINDSKDNMVINRNKLDKNKENKESNENNGVTEFEILSNISEKILNLSDLNESEKLDLQNEHNESTFVLFNGNIGGRLFISPETVDQYRSFAYDKSSQIYCYRRNSINIKFSLNFQLKTLITYTQLSVKKNEAKKMIHKMNIKLYSSLRHRTNKLKSKSITVLKENEEFIFSKVINTDFSPVSKNDRSTNTIKMNESGKTFMIMDLLNNEKNIDQFEFIWDQIKFKSATANNRHDAANKFYVIIVEVNFLSNDNEVLFNKKFESEHIIVRGRNPSFYSQKGDILIGKIKKNVTKNPVIKSANNIVLESRNDSDVNESLITREEVAIQKDIKKVEGALKRARNVDPSVSSYDNKKLSEPEEELAVNVDDVDDDVDDDDDDEISDSVESSSYQYFKVEDHYYLPPVDVGYFPHHVHHNKQVFKPSILMAGVSNGIENRKQYNYYI